MLDLLKVQRNAGVRLVGQSNSGYVVMISFKPLSMSSSSSGAICPSCVLRRSTDRVRIWLFLTQERFGKSGDLIGNGGLNGLAPIGKDMLGDELVDLGEQLLIKGYRHFHGRHRHLLSLV